MRVFLIAGLGLLACISSLSATQPAHAQTQAAPLTFLEETAEGAFAVEGWITALDGWPQDAEVRIALNYLSDKSHYYARIAPNAVQLFKVTDGKPARIGRQTGVKPNSLGDRIYFAIKRREWRMAIICGDSVAAVAYDDEYAGGRIATSVTSPKLALEDVAMQQTAPILLTDDFVREGGRTADWDPFSGEWRSTGIPSALQYATRSANAFTFSGASESSGLATAGYWFWDSYEYRVSVRPKDAGAVGLACCVSEPDKYLLFRWTPGPEGTKQLIAVRGEQQTVLAEEPGGYDPEQWYEVTLRTQLADLQAFVDGQLAIRARNAPLAQGGIGLYVEGGNALFDDVHVASYESFGDDFASNDGTAWNSASGQWHAADGVLRAAAGGRADRPCKAVAGREDWNEYVFAADVNPAAKGTVGLCFGYQGEDNYSAFAWDGPSKTAEIYQVHGGSVTSLAKRSLPYRAGNRHRLKVATDRGYLRAYVDNELVLDALEPGGAPGKVGLLTAGPSGAWFDNVVLWFAEPPPDEPPITQQFTAEATMSSWAGPLREWMYVYGQEPRLYLTKRTFYGDVELSMLLPDLTEQAQLDVVLCSDPDSLGDACRLSLTAGGSAGTARVKLTHGETTLAQSDAAVLPGGENMLRLGRLGPHLFVAVGDSLVCQAKNPSPMGGVRIGMQVQNAWVRLTQAKLTASNVRDYTFSEAPTDWYAQRGSWGTTDRWPCQRGWAWLAGTGDVAPILWSKRAFYGDMTVEVWAALVMDLPRSPGYSHPSDVNVSFCGNGRDVSSGYSFIYAGLNNTASMIMRRDELIARNDSMRFIDPRSSNPNFHRHWFQCRIEKRGSHISYHVDGRLVGEFDDPDALEGGHVALWSGNNNGLIVARARISYTDGGEIAPLPPLRLHGDPIVLPDPPTAVVPGLPQLPRAPVQLPVYNDFERDAGQWQPLSRDPRVVLSLDGSERKDGRRSLRITNATTGGSFAAVAIPGSVPIAEAPVLSFDYRLPPEVKVNIHLRINGRDHAVVFGGPDSFPSSVRRLGQIDGVVADHKWRTARFDLLGALRTLYPSDTDFEASEITFVSRTADPYLSCGLGGNYWGAGYNIDNFHLGPAS